MNGNMLTLYLGLFKDASEYRVPVSKLARIKRKMESGKNNDFCKVIPLLLREIEIQIRRSIKEGQKRNEALISLNIRRNQFLELKEEGAYRKGK